LRKAFKNGDNFTDANGWVTVEEKSLQSKIYKNVFAVGDCANTTNKKTAAVSFGLTCAQLTYQILGCR
jgi:NADH dehydrogenase FAD-containing subunit